MGGWCDQRLCTMKLGARGQQVLTLQQRLAELGYDPGPKDGNFGYLTQDALLQFQDDFGLHSDGIAGPVVLGLLAEEIAPVERRVYVLRAGESIEDAARRLRVSIEALRNMNQLTPRAKGYLGQRLVCRQHYIVAAFAHMGSVGWLERTAPLISAIALPGGSASTSELQLHNPPEAHLDVARHTGLDIWLMLTDADVTAAPPAAAPAAPAPPAATLAPPAAAPAAPATPVATPGLLRRRWTSADIAELVAQAKHCQAGIWVHINALNPGEGQRYLRLLQQLHTAARLAGCRVMASVPTPQSTVGWRRLLTDLDYKRLQAATDKLVLVNHSGDRSETWVVEQKRVSATLRQVPPWRTLLLANLYAQERDAHGKLVQELSYIAALTQSYKVGVRPSWDAERGLFRAELPERTFWLPARDAVRMRLELADRLHMAGVVLWPVGQEDQRTWPMIFTRLKPLKQDTAE